MLKITEFAKLCGVTVHTLRYYDKCSILCPRETDPSSGYRYYHPEQKKDVETILTLKDLGFSLEDIRFLRPYSYDMDLMDILVLINLLCCFHKI